MYRIFARLGIVIVVAVATLTFQGALLAERATADTGLPLIVCNRTGKDTTLSFVGAESVVAHGGERLLSLSTSAPLSS